MGAKMFPNDDFLQSLLTGEPPLCDTVTHEHFSAQLLAEGILLIEPHQAGEQDIVLSCGIHGNETAPIELCNQLLQQIFAGTLVPKQRLLFIFGNPPAMRQATRFVDENLNRLFCGSHQQAEANLERSRAAELEQALVSFFRDATRSRLHWDLHTAIRGSIHEKFAVCPYQPQRGYRADTLALLACAGIEAFLFNHAPAFTFSYHSSYTFGADAFTVELGKVAPFGENDLSRLSALERVLRALITQQPLASDDALAEVKFYQVKRVITREQPEFSFAFSDDTANFTTFTQGDVIAKNGDKTIFCDVTGEAVVFPNAKVAIGQRAALCVVPVTLKDVCM
ncbi:succinylglutamate desuccinylase [Shewanella sp.]|uniref:succinylglutamate desuccinylase n=1 Tax=Shewanella sp. TaxID=50422 RepID=UPI003A981706